MNKKVVLIQGLLAPYRYPIFEELSKVVDWDFEVWFMGKSVKNRIWDEDNLESYTFKYTFLKGITFNVGIKDNYPFWLNTSIWKQLLNSKPDAVVMMGWDSLTSFIVHLYCMYYKVKFVLYGDSTSEENSWRRSITKPIVRWHVRNADSLISGGTRSMRYLESLGAKSNKIHISYNTIDVNRYINQKDEYKNRIKKIRQDLGIDDKNIVIMYYAQFIERKGVDILVKAFDKLKRNRDNVTLLLVGDGKFKLKITSLIKERAIVDVILIDNPGDTLISKYYSIADIFVLPSREDVWGLVVNEAMSSELPVIVSNKAGCVEDLVINRHNGFSFESENVEDLYQKLENLVSDPELARRMGKNSLNLVKKYSPHLTAKKFIEAIND